MNKISTLFLCALFFLLQNPVFAVEAAPHISDREIVERLTRLEEGQKALAEGFQAFDKGLNKRMDDLRSEMNSRFEGVDKCFEGVNQRFEEVNNRFDEVNHRFDTLQWMLGLFITIALVIFGFILRLMWQMHRKQAQMEATLETQRTDFSFIKGLVEKFLLHKGTL